MRTLAGVLLTTLFIPGPSVLAQVKYVKGTDDAEKGLVERLAPTLHFGPDEKHFPTVPFFSAMDGLNNAGDDGLDFDDLQEIAPLNRDGDRASWPLLLQQYEQTRDRFEIIPSPAAFYRVRELTDSDRRELWRYLRKDVQAWSRLEMDEKWCNEAQNEVSFQVVEYYFYYLDDKGLEGHPEDIEFVFIFLPSEDDYECEDHGAPEPFHMVVGAGHSPRESNNVLLLFEDVPVGSIHILVELGGHASAPDRHPADKKFEVGKDVNWHAADAWGTRDILARTGTGFGGRYLPWMTYEREGAAVLLPSEYQLLPVKPFEELYEALGPEADPDTVLQRLEAVADVLEPFEAPKTLDEDALRRLKQWDRDLDGGTKGILSRSKHQVWRHRHYTNSPTLILKSHLYRPAYNSEDISGIPNLITWGVAGYPSEGAELSLGLVTPILKIPVVLPGIVELTAGVVFRDFSSMDDGTFTAGAIYDYDYKNRLGWYARLGYVRNRAETLDEWPRADFTLSGGPSLLLWSWDRRRLSNWGYLFNALRIRVGPRIDLVRWDEFLDQVDLELRISFKQ